MAGTGNASETTTSTDSGSGLPPALLSGTEAEQVFRRMLENAGFDLNDIASHPGSRKHILDPKAISECLQHPDGWDIFAIDSAKVELDAAVAAVLHVQNEMLKRFNQMGASDKSHYSSRPDEPKAIMFVLDAVDCLFAMSDEYDEITKTENRKKIDAAMTLAQIARIGKIAGIHVMTGEATR